MGDIATRLSGNCPSHKRSATVLPPTCLQVTMSSALLTTLSDCVFQLVVVLHVVPGNQQVPAAGVHCLWLQNMKHAGMLVCLKGPPCHALRDAVKVHTCI